MAVRFPQCPERPRSELWHESMGVLCLAEEPRSCGETISASSQSCKSHHLEVNMQALPASCAHFWPCHFFPLPRASRSRKRSRVRQQMRRKDFQAPDTSQNSASSRSPGTSFDFGVPSTCVTTSAAGLEKHVKPAPCIHTCALKLSSAMNC